LTYLDDRSVELDEKKEAQTMYAKKFYSALRGNASDFTNYATIEAASTLNSNINPSLSQKIKHFWDQSLSAILKNE
jgi:hypothetical protein